MFRSGPLTPALLEQILAKVRRHPHDLMAVAKACNVYPADLLCWYVAGQDPACKDRLMSELAWKVNEARFELAAENYDRVVAAANGGKKTKTVTKPKLDGEGEGEYVETTVEDVLPAAWAVEKIDALSKASHWAISPNAEQAEELHKMMAELQPTPLLTEGAAGLEGRPAPDPPEPAADEA
jgi:hypothetical protein